MKIQIVDENDQLIGVRERSTFDYSSYIYRASALWITNSRGQALLAKRSSSKDKDPGKWGPAVSGTIDEGETYDGNIYKEADEEIGLTDITFKKGKKYFIQGKRTYFCQWYFAIVDREPEDFRLQPGEVDKLAWIDIDRLKAELISKPDKYIAPMKGIIDDLGI